MKGRSVTVVIPVFNRQAQAEAALRSAVAQEGCELEVVIVDDASPVAFTLPPNIGCDPRVRLIRSPLNAGPAATRNIGIRAASHDWIAFLDSDDRFLPGKLARQLRVADPARPLDVIASGFAYARRATGQEQHLIPIETGDLATFSAGCWHCPGSTALISRAAFDIVGLLDERLRRLEDFEWFIRLGLKGGSLNVVPEVLSWIDVDANASTENVDRAAATIAADYLGPASPLPKGPCRKNLAAYLALERGAAHLKKKGPLAAAPHLLRSWLARPRAKAHLKTWWRTISEENATAEMDVHRRP